MEQNTQSIKDNKRVAVNFAGLDPYIQDNIIKPEEKEIRGQKFIEQGTDNMYPQYLFDLYSNVTTLQTIINGISDYVVGDGVKSNVLGLSDEDAERLVRNMALSYGIFGGFYLNVLRNKLGGIAKVCPVDARKVRTDLKNEWYYYSDDFCKKSYGRGKYLCYPKFDVDQKNVASSIYYYKNGLYTVYAQPMWGACTVACETEKLISDFHINAIKNGFASNVIVSFNNGVPTDELREEIEEMFEEKFCSAENAGRPILTFNDDKEHSVEVQKIDVDNFSDRYEALSNRTKQEIFTAFKANKNLFGIPTDNNGFSSEEYDESFKLFNRTVIKPIQKIIVNTLNNIYGVDSAIEIEPFSIDWGENNSEEETVE